MVGSAVIVSSTQDPPSHPYEGFAFDSENEVGDILRKVVYDLILHHHHSEKIPMDEKVGF